MAAPFTIAFRPLHRSDADLLAAWEKAGSPSPWSAKQFLEEFEKPASGAEGLEVDGRLAGYGVFWMVAGEAQLCVIGVDPDLRRRGWGRRMLEHLLKKARAAGAGRMTLEVRAGNAAALKLYEGAGFRETGRRPRFYEGREDALLMERSL